MAKPTRKEIYGRELKGQSRGFRDYFSGVPRLLTGDEANLPAALAYHFHLVETGHHRVLYGCLCRLHEANSVVARNVVNRQHMTRDKFRELFENVVGEPISQVANNDVRDAERIRDNVVHGKSATDAQIWSAIQSLLGYSVALNRQVKAKAGFEAFGDMRGFVGRKNGTPLKPETTKWLLKGMGFNVG